MPIRIYALAKQLDIENKQLVDICTKLGIHGKGSALASLSDEEVKKIEEHFKASAAPPPAAPAPIQPPPMPTAPPVMRKLDSIHSSTAASGSNTTASSATSAPANAAGAGSGPNVRLAPIPATPPAPRSSPLSTKLGGGAKAPVQPAATAPPVVKEQEPTPVKSVAPVEPTPVSTPAAQVPVEPQAPLSPQKRDDIFPSRFKAPLRDLTQRKKTPDGQDEGNRNPTRKDGPPARGPGVRLAAMPEVKQPVPHAKKSEERVQKPDIALPLDSIKKAKRGAAPLRELTEMTKQKNEKKKRDAEKDPKAPRKDEPAVAARVDLDAAGKPKNKKAKSGTEQDLEFEGPMPDKGLLKKKRGAPTRRDEETGEEIRQTPYRRLVRQRKGVSTAAPRKEAAVLVLPCTIREFSEAAGVGVGQVLKGLMELGVPANINASLNEESAHLLADHLRVRLEIKQPPSLEEKLMADYEAEEDPDGLEFRPPIVTFLGHVDHGKTSLLDRIIGINVVSGEAGGITQHIRAYSIEHEGRRVSFVDTPGHEAFTEMRARGANVTDIAVLVVAADDGIMPQTEEAISHAKAAGVPIVVALNKIDLPGVNQERILQELAAHELLPSEWGGEVEVVRTSALTGLGVDQLIETLLTTAELYEYRANPERSAMGTCLETEQESGRGVVAKVVVQNGTLNVGDIVVCGTSYGRVKAMYNTLKTSERVDSAGPSMPVNLTGLDEPPAAGDKFYVVKDIAKAREIAEARRNSSRQRSLSGVTVKVSLEEFQQRLEAGTLGRAEEMVTLNLIVRADTRGSIEAIQKELSKLAHPEVQVKILQASVGGVTVADVTLAHASQAVVIGFNVVPDENARALAEEKQVEIRRYDIIYKVTDDIRASLEGKLKPEAQTVEMGTAAVLKTFSVSRVGMIAGCRIMRGTIDRDCRIRLIRDSRILGDYGIDTLKREKDDAKEVRQGMECGIKLLNFNDIKEGDTLEAYKIEHVARTLDG